MKQITVDFTNILNDSVGEQGISLGEIKEIAEKAKKVHNRMEAENHFFRSLPMQDITEIVEYGKFIKNNFDNFLLLGIGGSALGPEALFKATSNTFHNCINDGGAPRCFFEDNVDPDRMFDLLKILDLSKTCINVISKSGRTIETLSQFMIILEKIKEVCPDDWQKNFVFTTDAKNGFLNKFAKEHGIKMFIIPEEVGGRFSIFTPVGLLPGVVCGCDIQSLLLGAANMNERCKNDDFLQNPAYLYAAVQYLMMNKGKNIAVMMPYADCLKYVTDWFSQLWAESLGKRFDDQGNVVNTGQTPVRAVGTVDQHSQLQLYVEGPFDKVVTLIGLEKFKNEVKIPCILEDQEDVAFLCDNSLNRLINSEYTAVINTLTSSKRPNIVITMPTSEEYYLGQLFMMLEIATVFAGYLLNINPFDQPGVEDGKVSTYALMGKDGFEQRRAELETVKEERFKL